MNFRKKTKNTITLCDDLVLMQKFYFTELKPSKIPDVAGVYAIFNQFSEVCLYVGRTKKSAAAFVQQPPHGSTFKETLLGGNTGFCPDNSIPLLIKGISCTGNLNSSDSHNQIRARQHIHAAVRQCCNQRCITLPDNEVTQNSTD